MQKSLFNRFKNDTEKTLDHGFAVIFFCSIKKSYLLFLLLINLFSILSVVINIFSTVSVQILIFSNFSLEISKLWTKINSNTYPFDLLAVFLISNSDH